ncbi:MAG: hypothetical protein AB7Q27_22260 [Acidimicrobiia bacterium]
MGIDVYLCNERGVPIESSFSFGATLPSGLLPVSYDGSSSTLRFVDPYGNTMFNHHQAAALSDELSLMVAQPMSDEDRDALHTVIELANTCAAGAHLYLWFIGD